ncbi:uncharacterized protein V2V93DRAFT_372867 [Kockiozyma suomiensis]|uniref:uncharacterized protein n=1 Tax=Kockiozyma suomiensis TaxID=1337062 RepID=UPI003343FEC4
MMKSASPPMNPGVAGGQVKRRPPSLIIDKSLITPQGQSSSFPSGDSSSDSQKTSPSSTSNSSHLMTRPTKSAKEIIQNLAIHCVSPGLPPMNNAMVENIIKCKEIEKQQRLLISLRQKTVEIGPDIHSRSSGASDGYDDSEVSNRNRANSEIALDADGNYNLPHKKSKRMNLDISTSNESRTGRRFPIPSNIRVVAPNQYQEAGYERAIRSAPLSHSMRSEHSEQVSRPDLKQHMGQRFFPVPASVPSPGLMRQRKFPQRLQGDGIAICDERVTSTHYGQHKKMHPSRHHDPSDFRASSVPSAHPSQFKRPLGHSYHDSQGYSDPSTIEFESEEHQSFNEQRGHPGKKRSFAQSNSYNDNLVKRRKFLELCSEMWDIFHDL